LVSGRVTVLGRFERAAAVRREPVAIRVVLFERLPVPRFSWRSVFLDLDENAEKATVAVVDASAGPLIVSW
jgi:hypothetical protein